MKQIGIITWTILLCLAYPLVNAKTPGIYIIPRPAVMEKADGAFKLSAATRIYCPMYASHIGTYLAELLRPATAYPFNIKGIAPPADATDLIQLVLKTADTTFSAEAYHLQATPDKVIITAGTLTGLFYGVQSFRQLLPPAIESRNPVGGVPWSVPAVTIRDQPRFKWRGLHLDVVRHMFPIDFLKKYIDLLALHKLNTLHLHLTDDQGWRLEIKKYPKLIQIGSLRDATPLVSRPSRTDGKIYQGHYTQEQIKDMVAYAQSRFVTIVPEIEMPGHSTAALASYPELGCTNGPYKVRTKWGPGQDVFCAGNEQVYTFLQDVLTEVLALFPSPYIHIGGDECPKKRWKACAKCQARIKKEKLRNENQLQSYFINRINAFLKSRGRKLVGWDEILQGGLPSGATVMSWQGIKGGITAARAGHDVVMSPNTHCYFDYYQSKNRKSEPPAMGGYLPLQKVYSFDPVPPKLPPDKAGHILGAQGNVWTEFIPNGKQVEYMVFPRAAALAEVVWSPPVVKNYQDFLIRLRPHVKRLKELYINYRNPF